MKIAIIGSGISGLACAHVLGPHHDVTIFEARDRLGGHSNTVTVDDPAAGEVGIDTGFIVHNDQNYPNIERLFADLGVEPIDTEMSFGVADEATGFFYRATNLDTIFADRRNLKNPTMYKMLADIFRFYRHARTYLDRGDPTKTLGEFLDEHRYGSTFVDLHLIPMGASIWSADPATFADFPAVALFRFLDNHGLLGLGDRPQWKALVGGSRTYVERIAARFDGEICLSTPVRSIERSSDAATIRTDRDEGRFDAVVMACHSDQALGMLADPTSSESEILGAIRYQPNTATLHTDTSVLPPTESAWAAWNYYRRSDGQDAGSAVLTYDMNQLMGLETEKRYLVSLNEPRIDPEHVLYEASYSHPVFDRAAMFAQLRVGEISGTNRTHYAGAYWSYGFHEDGMASGLRVCRELDTPWALEAPDPSHLVGSPS